MRYLAILILAILSGCSGIQAHISITTTDPVTGVTDVVTVDSARRTAISTNGVTVITGQVAISDETVKVLSKTVTDVAGVDK